MSLRISIPVPLSDFFCAFANDLASFNLDALMRPDGLWTFRSTYQTNVAADIPSVWMVNVFRNPSGAMEFPIVEIGLMKIHGSVEVRSVNQIYTTD